MQSLDPKPYALRQGDTMISIARQFGVSNWKDIYENPSNAAFRKLRPDPNRLQAGDRLMIPPSPQMVRQVLQQRLNSLMRLRLDTDNLYRNIGSDMSANLRKYETVAGAVDAGAMVATVLVSVGTIVFKGMGAMKLSGAALDAANHELAKQSLELAYDPLKEPILQVAAGKINANSGIVWAIGKASIQAFLEIQSPSWWAGVVGNLRDGQSWSQAVTRNPEDVLRAAQQRIEKQRMDTLSQIDGRLRATRALLSAVAS